MKRKDIAWLCAGVFCTIPSFAQDTTRISTAKPDTSSVTPQLHKEKTVYYTGIYNYIPEMAGYPMIGVVNVADGNQRGVQIGVSNMNQGALEGVQIGFTNAAGGGIEGAQIGFVNATRGKVKGVQVGFGNYDALELHGVQSGFVNYAGKKVHGAQAGFVNATRGNILGWQAGYVNVGTGSMTGVQTGFVNHIQRGINGIQAGFVNTTGQDCEGVQAGFVNVSGGVSNGVQAGFVNVSAKESEGVKAGFINVTHGTHKGTMVGFINVADSISEGMPIGFLSVVKKGGFYALELGTSELYPYHLGFKIGVTHLHTVLAVAWNPYFNQGFAYGVGLAGKFNLGKRTYVSPELIQFTSAERYEQRFTRLGAMFGVSAGRFSFQAGPDVVWSQNNDYFIKGEQRGHNRYAPGFSLFDEKIDRENYLHLGVRASVVLRLNE